jgi:hypothetical protein
LDSAHWNIRFGSKADIRARGAAEYKQAVQISQLAVNIVVGGYQIEKKGSIHF